MATQERIYHSQFGGLWIDRHDWIDHLAQQQVTAEERQMLHRFQEDGYIILRNAADSGTIGRFRDRIKAAFEHGNAEVVYQEHGDHTLRRLREPADPVGVRVVDSFVPLSEALDLFSSPQLVRFLEILFRDQALLFQSLSFDKGSQQGLHQDTAYVVVNEPLQLAACWIALEDVKPGSGELMYVPGSHRLPDWQFGAGRKHWNAEVDGNEIHDRWGDYLASASEITGRQVERFLAKAGDILIWHADLAHGGSPITDEACTRRSLVGHFCPRSCRPHYFDNPPFLTTVKQYGRLHYSSQHYNLSGPAPVPLVND